MLVIRRLLRNPRMRTFVLCIQCTVTGVSPAGFPHSDICGSLCICHSPQLFAAYHVFLRLSVPRHPPCALHSLTKMRNAYFGKIWLTDACIRSDMFSEMHVAKPHIRGMRSIRRMTSVSVITFTFSFISHIELMVLLITTFPHMLGIALLHICSFVLAYIVFLDLESSISISQIRSMSFNRIL